MIEKKIVENGKEGKGARKKKKNKEQNNRAVYNDI